MGSASIAGVRDKRYELRRGLTDLPAAVPVG